jgi:hypothetical protein
MLVILRDHGYKQVSDECVLKCHLIERKDKSLFLFSPEKSNKAGKIVPTKHDKAPCDER